MARRVAVTVLALVAILCFVTSTAHADATAYSITSANQLGTIDLITGVFTPIGNTGATTRLLGLGSAGGKVYSGTFLQNTLYQINVSNGSATSIGHASPLFFYDGFGSTAGGLFGIDTLSQDLYSINPSTGASTLLGPTGLVPGAVDGMSAGPGGLFLAELTGSGDVLYNLNTSTGTATMIGNTGVLFIGAMVWVDSTLYAVSSVSNSSVSVWSLNTTTGAATFVANTSGGGNNATLGLAPTLTATPEPSSFVLLGSGLLAALGAVRRKLMVLTQAQFCRQLHYLRHGL